MKRLRHGHSIAVFGAAAFVLAVVSSCQHGRAQTPDPVATIRNALTQLARNEADFAPLAVTFNDLHGLHGGLQLTIHGDGKIEQKSMRIKAGAPKDKVAQDDLKSLVALLVKHEVWAQRVAERQAVPDESRSTLKTCYRGQCVEIWEWSNDVDKHARIGDVRKLMEKIAWRRPAPASWKVTIDTGGGFTGRGTGSVEVLSDGTVRTGRGFSRPCGAKVAAADLELLARAVVEAQPATWKPEYVRASNPHGCCDQFRYTLTLELQHAEGPATKHSTRWYSEMSNALPVDVRGLFEAAWKSKKENDARCKDP